MRLLFQLDGILFGFLLLSSSSVFQSAAVPADGILFPHLRQALFVIGQLKKRQCIKQTDDNKQKI
jgi:hypothetical protein